ncbi:hypothetical protein [Burkholderia aenigmatica]|uniref:hypothetical protein n=1 Tax=Burkholderia aenigmatica TaxID=2015348 RepID=UPI002654941D|nr:hypothetical protein [Burkholderia aenigmatica]MDN7876709.1 hypothetical protein [Burkholderia aenigmatica]
MKLQPLGFLAVALMAGLLVPGLAFAAIDLMPKEITVDNDVTTAQIVNKGDRPEYVTISLARLVNPGVPLSEEKLEQVGDMARPTLYAYPFKLTLAPGQTKTIILKPMREVDTETVYRLNVKPAIKVLGEEKAKAVGNVVVNLGFSGLVRQLPSRERKALSVTCDAYGARLTASGNVRYRMSNAKVDGRTVERFNVYPGVPLPLQGQVVEIPGQATCRGGAADLGL